MKKWIALAASLAVSAAHADGNDEILRKIENMQQQMQAQQEMIIQLRTQLEEQQKTTTEIVKQEVDAAVSEGLAQSGGSTISLGTGIDGLTLKGDLRLRYEWRGKDTDSSDTVQKTRFRHRVRLGGVWKNTGEDWEIGLGIEAGSSKGNSANDSWNSSSVWESGDLAMDYAYAKHVFGDSGFSAIVGQQKNPWKCTFLTFDGDLRPTGATLGYKQDMFFATLGAYNLRGDVSGKDASLANMYGGQLGMDYKTESMSALLAVGLFYYDAETAEYMLSTKDYNYEIGTIYGEVGTKAGSVDLKAIGEFAMNFGADDAVNQGAGKGGAPASLADYSPEDNNMAWTLGVEAKFDKFKASYAYAYIEGDAIPYFVSDSDFGAAVVPTSDTSVNVHGHKLGLAYAVSKNCSVSATAFFTELIEPSSSYDGDKGTLYQFDLSYKF